MSECPTCGREDFKSENGMKQHHSRTHGESLSMVDLTCEVCGDSYQLRASKAEGSRYCSNDCKFEWLHTEGTERNTTTVTCENCGSDVERFPHQLDKKQGNFCDRDCWTEWHSGENHLQWGGGKETVQCTVCGADVERYPARAEDFDRHFCSKSCHYQWVSENHSGEDHPSWKGGVAHEYPGGWGEARKRALERDNYQCRACGISMDEHREFKNISLDVHHVVPVREFDDPADAHSLGNLVTACRSCHSKYESLPVFPQ